jgi:formylglycine-generating enzyme required for sulfatase activity
MMSEAMEQEQWREWAEQAVNQFVRRFSEPYRLLAYHAALPLVLTPELLNYIRNEFLRGEALPWVAEVDLLLSDLCSQVGYELYAMKPQIRSLLLEQMAEDQRCGKLRMKAVAQVLMSYVKYLSQVSPQRRYELEAQRWAAMVFLGDEDCNRVAQEIAERLQQGEAQAQQQPDSQQGIRAEMARLTRIVNELEPQLRSQPALIEYAQLVQQLIKSPQSVDPEVMERSHRVEGVELRAPVFLVPPELRGSLSELSEAIAPIPGFPALQEFEFEVVTIGSSVQPSIAQSTDVVLEVFEFRVARIEGDLSKAVDLADVILIVRELAVQENRGTMSDIEGAILQGVFDGDTYEAIATRSNISVSHLKQAGRELGRWLSQAIGEKVTKQNMRQVLTRFTQYKAAVQFYPGEAQQFIESLGNGVPLEMVSIPEGQFEMGSPTDELERFDDESPQHPVSVPAFFIGKFPVTQAQWRAIASLPQVNRELNPDPSRFNGSDRPVETILWEEAVEFCDRLSAYTNREYRLPSEAEWEYACRGGTTTPFHFGETITTDLANYNGNSIYGNGVKGVYRSETTPVGSFEVANAFGLYDMHGNVWEWCADHWHDNYIDAPSDGSAWIEGGDRNLRVIRGGSWIDGPWNCRSAYRNRYVLDDRSDYLGFRVVCSVPRTS